MQKAKNSIHYVDNKKFHQAILDYRTAVAKALIEEREPPRIPNYIGDCLQRIAYKLSLKPNFINYSFREEMVSDGVENCILYFNDFDPTKGQNPFAYFTTVIYYAFLRRIYKEEKNRYTICKIFQETMSTDSHLLMDADDNHVLTPGLYDNINDFMGRFERKEEAKKTKRKSNKEGLSKFYDDQD